MLRPPQELRDTFDLLGQSSGDLDQAIDRIDWTEVSPQQVSYAVLARLPQDLVYSGLIGVPFDPRAYFRALLLSAEFQSEFVPNLLGAFPEKPRRFFVHVPRSGGTSLAQTLSVRACPVPHTSIGADWCNGREFLRAASEICRNLHDHDSIHISGHYTLRSIVDGRLARFGDSIYTTVRNPRDIVLSFINYIMTILQSDIDQLRPDTREWARLLKLKSPIGARSAEQSQQLLRRMLRHDQLLPKDMLCHFLGDGAAASSLDLLAAANVEIIDATRLDSWREQHAKAPAQPWANVSNHFFAWDTLDDGQRRQIDALIRQDTILHRIITASFGEAASVRGLQVAHAAQASTQPAIPAAGPKPGPRRIRRASRPILLDPGFTRPLPAICEPAGLGWGAPPPSYRTFETTLQFPTLDTRIRIRYARRAGYPRKAWLQDRFQALRHHPILRWFR